MVRLRRIGMFGRKVCGGRGRGIGKFGWRSGGREDFARFCLFF